MQERTNIKSVSTRCSPDILSLTWEEKVNICKEWRQSFLSKRTFCAQKEISISTFTGWCNKLWQDDKKSTSNLCPVKIVDSRNSPSKLEPIVLEVSFPNAVVARVKATAGQFSFLFRELLDATAIIR